MFQCCWKPGPHFVKKENNMQRWGRGFAPINSIISLNSAPALPFLQFFPFFFFWFKWHQAEFLSPQLESRSTVKLSIPKGILLTKISSTCCCHPFAPPHPHSARRPSCSCLWVPLTLDSCWVRPLRSSSIRTEKPEKAIKVLIPLVGSSPCKVGLTVLYPKVLFSMASSCLLGHNSSYPLSFLP